MPTQLTESNLIDQEGPGSTPGSGSTYRLVEPIPRGRARPGYSGFGDLCGGPPRCPVCLDEGKCVARNGDRFDGKYNSTRDESHFHCNRCRVRWRDSNQALCYVCDAVFDIPTKSRLGVFGRPGENEGMFSCYGINNIEHPCCPSCEVLVGASHNQHSRRQLRRMVGLRAALRTEEEPE